MSKIIEIANLIEYILNPNNPREEKVAQLKLARNDGLISEDDAIDLVCEYL